jgi:spiro-SPASM protein
MRALTVLYGASLASQAFQPFAGCGEQGSPAENAFVRALERARRFPGSEKLVLLAGETLPSENSLTPGPELSGDIVIIRRSHWDVSQLLKILSELSADYDFAYYAWADSPFLDPALAGRIAERHIRYAAEYSYADGWPYGLGPELITGAAAGILYKIAGGPGGGGAGAVKRDTLFAVLQKDINSFDIETEISPVDLRYHRLSLTADSKRNLLLVRRFAEAGCSNAEDAERIIAEHPEYLRILPAFFPIQAAGPCPLASLRENTGACALCPYPKAGGKDEKVTDRQNFMDPADFDKLLDKIEGFAGDGVIDLSLWGELGLHPHKEELIRSVLQKPSLSLVIETSGFGWGREVPEKLAQWASAAPARFNGLPPLSWIVSLNPADLPSLSPGGEGEAVSLAKRLAVLFPREAGKEDKVYVQAVRTAGAEDAIEQFYRAWKACGTENPGPAIIIQKYDSFCGFLPDKQAVDLSPVERRPCWHLMRDMPILIDGKVPVCREDLQGTMESRGNALQDDLESIWQKGEEQYRLHCSKNYGDPCTVCDEYYTFNF